MEEKASVLKLTIGTYNIRNTTDRYDERVELLKQTILNAKADILGLQEVAFGKGGQLDYLVADPQNEPLYDQYNAESQMKFHEVHEKPSDFRIDGNSIVISKEFSGSKGRVLEHEVLHLSGVRVAHRTLVKLTNDITVWVVNCHLHHLIEDPLIRAQQVTDICNWMKKSTRDNSNVLILGDFNTPPHEPAYKILQETFEYKSTHLTVHGTEPAKTFPTGIQAPNMDADPDGTFDYIWYKGEHVRAVDVKIIGNLPKPGDDTIYPSDHYGLVADFDFSI
jgi:endonuclease/exonuclease/phosphatase family metal-dependent hydrolase